MISLLTATSPVSGRLVSCSRFSESFRAIARVAQLITVCFLMLQPVAFGLGQDRYVEMSPRPGSFPLVQAGIAAMLCVDSDDYAGVVRAAHDLQNDIRLVTGVAPAITNSGAGLRSQAIIIGTIGKSPLIDELIRKQKIRVASITGKWESFLIQVVPDPIPGIASGLVIAGSDKRGTIYGIYDLSEQIGVSPWYWWADVPVLHKDAPGDTVDFPFKGLIMVTH